MTQGREWRQVRLGDVASMSSGGTPPSSSREMYGGGVPWVSISDMTRGGKYIEQTERTLTEDGLANSAARLYPVGVVLYAMYASLGECSLAVGQVSSSQAILGIDPGPELDPEYLYYHLQAAKPNVVKMGQHGTQANLNAGMVRDFVLPLPNKAEQRSIASALSDVDELIGALERIIRKKRDVKQGAMQQLLTGRTRLPGFEGEWLSTAIGALGATYGGLTGKTKADFDLGEALYVPFMAVIENVTVDGKDLPSVRVEPHESQNGVAAGDLLFNGSSETPDELALCAVVTSVPPNTFLNSFCFGFRLSESGHTAANPLFLAYLFRSDVGRVALRSLAQGATRYNLAKSPFRRLEFSLPPLDEQRAIVRVLSDMDAEIEALEARLEKTRDIKQGMMQELLTGRTRMVPTEDAVAEADDGPGDENTKSEAAAAPAA